MELQFKCPGCGGAKLEEILENATQTSQITKIEIVDLVDLELIYGTTETTGGEVTQYQCGECGKLIAETIGELQRFLLRNENS